MACARLSIIFVARKRDWVKPKLPQIPTWVKGAQRLDPKGPGLRWGSQSR